MKEGTLGVDWDGAKNCVHIKNLPVESQKIGSRIYFKSYKSADSPHCLAIYLGLPMSITIENYAFQQCP